MFSKKTKAISFLLFLFVLGSSAMADIGAYATYWNGKADGYGGGLKLEKQFLGFFAADVSMGWVDFSDIQTEVVPVEAKITARIPFIIEPYIGVGAGYYYVDSEHDFYDSSTGYFGVLGVQADIFGIGALAEVRYVDADERFLDGTTVNVGLIWRW